MSSNRVFNVNGRLDRDGQDVLLATLQLAFLTAGVKVASGYRISNTHGFVLYRYDSGKSTKFPCGLSAERVFPQIVAWFESRPACELTGWDRDSDHDGHNGPGWRVFCEDWGHVDHEYEAFIAIKPAFMWYGK